MMASEKDVLQADTFETSAGEEGDHLHDSKF